MLQAFITIDLKENKFFLHAHTRNYKNKQTEIKITQSLLSLEKKKFFFFELNIYISMEEKVKFNKVKQERDTGFSNEKLKTSKIQINKKKVS